MKNDRGDESTAITGLWPTRGNGWEPRDLFTRRDDSSGKSRRRVIFHLVGFVRSIDDINKIIYVKRCSKQIEVEKKLKRVFYFEALKKKKKNPKIFCNIEDFKNRKSFWKNLTMDYCRSVIGNRDCRRGIGNFDRN